RRGLAQRAGPHLLPQTHHSSFGVEPDVDRDAAAADGRAPFGRALRVCQPRLMRNRGGEPKDGAVVKRSGHGADVGWLGAQVETVLPATSFSGLWRRRASTKSTIARLPASSST